MIKTETLQLPIYNTPDVDTFNLTDINTAHTTLEAFANEFINNPNILIEREVVNARGSEISLDARLDKIDTNINAIQSCEEIFTTSEKNKLLNISESANKVTDSATNGNILIDGVETNVYTPRVKDYIFKAGDTCNALTGGYSYWKFSPEDIGASNDGTKITMEYGTGDTSATTVNSIDLTDYAKLYVDLEYVATNGTNIYGAIVIGYRRVWDVLFGSGYSRRIIEIDISNIVDLQTISFFGDGYGNARGRFNIYNAWLEQDGEILTTTEKNKLSGIANNANNYVHPTNHAPSIITQDVNSRFVTDVEKATWNGKATQSTIDTSINGIEIGGRNLLLKSADMKMAVSANWYTQSAIIGGADCEVVGTPSYSFRTCTEDLSDKSIINLKSGQITLGIDFKTNKSDILTLRLSIRKLDNTNIHNSNITIIPNTNNEWKRFYVVMNMPTDEIVRNNIVYFIESTTNIAINDTFSYRNIKLEKGNKPTDWTPAIEDVDSAIALKADKITSGTTSNRPVPTFIGQPYFDTDLGKQINAKTLSPVVWVDGVGTVC